MNNTVRFITDRQTLEDLNMLGKHRPGSVYSIFDNLKTRGGEHLLQRWFQDPLQDEVAINRRRSVFKFFQDLAVEFPFHPDLFNAAEHYLQTSASDSYPVFVAGRILKKAKESFFHDAQLKQLDAGFRATVYFLRNYINFLNNMERTTSDSEQPFSAERKALVEIFSDERLRWLKAQQEVDELSFFERCKYDYILRQRLSRQMKTVLESVYQLDVWISVSKAGSERGFSYAQALPAGHNVFQTSGIWHPGLAGGVANKLVFSKESNMLFLTGANMAGKSTLMKAFGIVAYLAHMGFPVPAKDLRFSVMQGLYSSINVSDNLRSGYSHFYAEVLRVKTVAEQVSKGKRLIILFDELFKGTNVKDAFEATLAVTRAFSKYRRCFFIVSTHIIEVGESLLDVKHLKAVYLPTIMVGNAPEYTYQLEPGITSDRQGMLIIENEGILDMLKSV